jgi:CelD/BcsL family acetyltransferase involved in cellulose biosynthesis
VVSSSSGFDALCDEWNDLLERTRRASFRPLNGKGHGGHFGESEKRMQLLIIVVREGDTAIGIAPLFIERVTVLGPLRYRRLSFVGRGTSDYLDLIVARGKEEVVHTEVAQYLALRRREYDVVLLEDIHDGSLSHTRFRAALSAEGFSGDRFVSEYCPRTTLRATWQETIGTFPSAHRNRLVKRMKTVTEGFHAVFEHVEDPVQIESAMDDFIKMHQARWNVIGHQGVFADRITHQFHRQVAPLLMRRGWLYLAFLRMNGERFAGDYGLIFRTECSTYLGGAYDAGEVNRHSPGNVLLMNIMRECHSLGVRVYDFMRGRVLQVPRCDRCTELDVANVPRGGHAQLHGAASSGMPVRRSAHSGPIWPTTPRVRCLFCGFLSYLVKRCATIVSDAIQKVREPEKSLVMGRDDK